MGLTAAAVFSVTALGTSSSWLTFLAFVLIDFGGMLSAWSMLGLCWWFPVQQGLVAGAALSAWQLSRLNSYLLDGLVHILGISDGVPLGVAIIMVSVAPLLAAVAILRLAPSSDELKQQARTWRRSEGLADE